MNYDYRSTPEGKRRFSHPAIYRLTWRTQNLLAKIGIAKHNEYSNECVSDFGCCTLLGRYWLRIPQRSARHPIRAAAVKQEKK